MKLFNLYKKREKEVVMDVSWNDRAMCIYRNEMRAWIDFGCQDSSAYDAVEVLGISNTELADICAAMLVDVIYFGCMPARVKVGEHLSILGNAYVDFNGTRIKVMGHRGEEIIKKVSFLLSEYVDDMAECFNDCVYTLNEYIPAITSNGIEEILKHFE